MLDEQSVYFYMYYHAFTSKRGVKGVLGLWILSYASSAEVRCQERDFADWQKHPPVKLVVFDFDETLTLATFMPRSKAITTKVSM